MDMIIWNDAKTNPPPLDPKWGTSKVVLAKDFHNKVGFCIYHTCDQLRTKEPIWFTGGGVGEDGVIITHWTEMD